MPCLQATPKFLADTGYQNPADVLHSPFQVAHNTDKLAYVWAMEQPKLMADFNLWMTEQHQGQKTWLDVFDLAGHLEGSSSDTLIFVDIGGGLGQQCALLKEKHPQLPGRVVLQDQPFVLPHAIPTDGVEKLSFDFWTEQPLKGEVLEFPSDVLMAYHSARFANLLYAEHSRRLPRRQGPRHPGKYLAGYVTRLSSHHRRDDHPKLWSHPAFYRAGHGHDDESSVCRTDGKAVGGSFRQGGPQSATEDCIQ